MANAHDLFHQAVIAKDPQLVRRDVRQSERWQRDFYQFGREKVSVHDNASLEKIAFLGYN